MDIDDYRQLIALIKSELGSIGRYDIADDENYVVSILETRETFNLTPKEHCLSLLDSLDRMLASEDRRTYDRSIRDINSILVEQRSELVVGAVVRSADGEAEFNLESVESLEEISSELRQLITAIRDSPDVTPSGPSEGPSV